MPTFENENLRAYRLLSRMEVVIRELLKTSLSTAHGPTWRRQIPGTLLKTIRTCEREEMRPQYKFVRLGPLYYLTFGELLTMLRQGSGKNVASQLGGDAFVSQLEGLTVPRNAVCHSRPVSPSGLKAVEALYLQVETAISREALERLLENPDVGVTCEEAAAELLSSLQFAQNDLLKLPQTFTCPELYAIAITQYWWADDDLAGFKRELVERAFGLLIQYNALPRGVGAAGIRQRFLEDHDLAKALQVAITELGKMAHDNPPPAA